MATHTVKVNRTYGHRWLYVRSVYCDKFAAIKEIGLIAPFTGQAQSIVTNHLSMGASLSNRGLKNEALLIIR